MNEKILEEHEIVRWVIRVIEQPEGKQFAYLVGFDKEENEYTTQSQVYYAGEYHCVDTDVICTTK